MLLVSLTSGSFGRAGAGGRPPSRWPGAVAAPLWGRVMDRAGPGPGAGRDGARLRRRASSLVVAVGRARAGRWSRTLGGAAAGRAVLHPDRAARSGPAGRTGCASSPLLDTAFAIEAVIDELTFVVGPGAGDVPGHLGRPGRRPGRLRGASGCVGSLAPGRAARHRAAPATAAARRGPHDAAARRYLLVTVVLASWACGGVFGGMEVVVVAFARERDVLSSSGVLLMCWAAGSLRGRPGRRARSTWRRPPLARYRIGAVALAVTLLPMPFVGPAWLLGVLLAVSGFAIAPDADRLGERRPDLRAAVRLTEALGWSGTGMSAGRGHRRRPVRGGRRPAGLDGRLRRSSPASASCWSSASCSIRTPAPVAPEPSRLSSGEVAAQRRRTASSGTKPVASKLGEVEAAVRGARGELLARAVRLGAHRASRPRPRRARAGRTRPGRCRPRSAPGRRC